MLSQTRLSYALGVVLLLLGTLLAGNADDRLGAVDAGARAAGVGARGAGQTRVRAEGRPPGMRLYNSPEFRSIDDINAYPGLFTELCSRRQWPATGSSSLANSRATPSHWKVRE